MQFVAAERETEQQSLGRRGELGHNRKRRRVGALRRTRRKGTSEGREVGRTDAPGDTVRTAHRQRSGRQG
ncbi:hypothetical protein Acsp06_14800 [Actinomycetospora sp. NBRC 106375]|nr:hypothetical protein Acsp06_14800 [Actinomycetospora sp. NBRC 106375]